MAESKKPTKPADPDLSRFEGQSLFRVSAGLAEAVNERVGVPLVTRSVLVDSVQVGILGKDGVRRVLPTLKVGKTLWSSVDVYLSFARECARADEEFVASRPSKTDEGDE